MDKRQMEYREAGETTGPAEGAAANTASLNPGPLEAGAVEEVARFELLEERALVEKRREIAGRVRVRREVERRTETLTVELLTETVVIEAVEGSSGVLIDGQPLLEGETRELITYREEAVITKRPVVSEEVRLLKRGVSNEQAVRVELGREVLRFDALNTQEEASLRPGPLGSSSLTDPSGGDVK